MTPRAQLLGAGVTVLALVVGGLGAWWLLRDTSAPCSVPTESVDDVRPAFVDKAGLLPAGSVGDARAPAVQAAEDLPPPFGPVVSGRFYGSEERVPQLVALGSDVVLAVPPTQPGVPSRLQDVSLPDGGPLWTRTFTGGPASGGPVGTLFVTAIGGATPTLLSVDADSGDFAGCVDVPTASGSGDATVLTDQAGSDVVLLATSPGAGATLSGVDPGQGEVTWDAGLPVPVEQGSVSAGPGQAVVSRVAHDPVRLEEMARAGGIEQPMVSAYSLDDGSPTWTYPTGEAVATTAASVLDTDSRTGRTTVVAVSGRGRGGTTSEVVALDADGALLWTRPLGTGFWDGSTWGDLLVLQGPDPKGGAVLRAFDVSDGTQAWTVSTRDFPAPRRALQRFGPPAPVGDRVVVTAPGGLAVIDPESGDAQAVRTSLHVDQVLAVGDHLLVRAGNALLVLEAEDG